MLEVERFMVKPEIKEMPTQEVLEAYLAGLLGPTTVYFDLERGVFVDRAKEKKVIKKGEGEE